uniref:OSJNBa0085C10.5 protein n=1 Tax=Oryza sativa subsp. japonica TaxID=39947 RepID=Q7X883_ORYSJ|nr:OSJNBa0085C10.5 [Oryza sativa Japonica Group]
MAKGAAGGDADEEEGEAGAGDGVPAKFGRGGGDAGEGGDAAVSKEETAASIGAPATNSSRLEGVQWHQCHWLPAGAPFRRVSGEETALGGSRPREERGTAAENSAGGHGRLPRKARAFPTIGGVIQGGIKGERE